MALPEACQRAAGAEPTVVSLSQGKPLKADSLAPIPRGRAEVHWVGAE